MEQPNKAECVARIIKGQFPHRDFVPLHVPCFIGREAELVVKCIESTFVSSVGLFVDDFEGRMCEYTGAEHAIATVNGTAALHIALLLAGVKSDEEVITQAVSFVATSNAIGYCSAHPVYIDSDQERLGMSPRALLEFLSQNTVRDADNHVVNRQTGRRIAACVPMHVFGHPVDIEAICEICRDHGIPVVEDAAESLGSFCNGQHTGTFGLLGILSFNGNKTVTTGGGGMILTRYPDLAKKAKHLTTTAKKPHPYEYFHDHIGYNYRMPNLNAALGCAQMETLPLMVASKRSLAEAYRTEFQSCDIDWVSEPPGCQSNYWLDAIRLSDRAERDLVLEHCNAHGVMVRPLWVLAPDLPMFAHCQTDGLEMARWLYDRVVNIPSSARL